MKNRRTTLLGVVDNDSGKMLATVRAREITGVAGVDNDLVVDKK